MSVSDGPASNSPKPLTVSRAGLLSLAGAAVVLVLLFVLPHELSRQLFLVVVVASVTYGLTTWRMRQQFRRLNAPQVAQMNAASLQAPAAPLAIPVSTASANTPKVSESVVRWLVSNRQARAQQMMLAAVILIGLAAFSFRPAVPYEQLGLGTLFLLIGVAVFGTAIWIAQTDDNLPLPTALGFQASGVNWVLLLPGVAMLFIGAEVSGNLMRAGDLEHVTLHFQFAMMFGGSIAVTWGLSGVKIPTLTALGWRVEMKELLLIVGLTVLALALRLVNLDNAVRVLIHEDFFLDIVNAIRDNHYQVGMLLPFNDFAPQPIIYGYWQSLLAQLFGRDLFTARLLSPILGTLTIPGIYLLARSLANRNVAFIAALFLATFPPHMHISRLALPSIVDALFGTLAIAFVARGLRTNRQSDFAIGGAMLGWATYWVDAGRVFFPLLVFVWLGIGYFFWRPRPSLRGVLTTVVTFTILALPYYYAVSSAGFPLFPRVENAGTNYWAARFAELGFASGVVELLTSISYSFLHYIHFAEIRESWLYYGGEQPLVLVWFVPLLLLGVAYALWRWRKPAGLLLVLWIIAAALGIGLARASATSIRFTVVFPALAFAMAFGIYGVLPLLLTRFRRFALILLVCMVAIGQVGYYFGSHLPRYNQQLRELFGRCGGSTDAILRSGDFSPGTNIYLISPDGICDHHEANSLLRFMRDDLTVVINGYEQYTDAYFANEVSLNHDAAFFVRADDMQMIRAIQRHFRLDEPQYSDFPEPAPGANFVLYYAHATPRFGPMRLVQP